MFRSTSSEMVMRRKVTMRRKVPMINRFPKLNISQQCLSRFTRPTSSHIIYHLPNTTTTLSATLPVRILRLTGPLLQTTLLKTSQTATLLKITPTPLLADTARNITQLTTILPTVILLMILQTAPLLVTTACSATQLISTMPLMVILLIALHTAIQQTITLPTAITLTLQ